MLYSPLFLNLESCSPECLLGSFIFIFFCSLFRTCLCCLSPFFSITNLNKDDRYLNANINRSPRKVQLSAMSSFLPSCTSNKQNQQMKQKDSSLSYLRMSAISIFSKMEELTYAAINNERMCVCERMPTECQNNSDSFFATPLTSWSFLISLNERPFCMM